MSELMDIEFSINPDLVLAHSLVYQTETSFPDQRFSCFLMNEVDNVLCRSIDPIKNK